MIPATISVSHMTGAFCCMLLSDRYFTFAPLCCGGSVGIRVHARWWWTVRFLLHTNQLRVLVAADFKHDPTHSTLNWQEIALLLHINKHEEQKRCVSGVHCDIFDIQTACLLGNVPMGPGSRSSGSSSACSGKAAASTSVTLRGCAIVQLRCLLLYLSTSPECHVMRMGDSLHAAPISLQIDRLPARLSKH